MKKIILINLVLVFVVYLLIDLFCFNRDVEWNQRDYVLKNQTTFFKYYLKTYSRIFYTSNDYNKMFIDGTKNNIFFRKPINTASPNSPLLLMGCSFTYGTGLNENQTFGYKLAHAMNRPVYNRAISAHGPSELLYQVKSEKFYSKIPKPEWFIYIFINDHIRRIKIPCSVVDNGVYYRNHNEILRRDFNFNTPLLYSLKLHIYENYLTPENIRLYEMIMKQSVKELKNHYGDGIKKLALIYEDKNIFNSDVFDVLKNAGFYVYFVQDLTDVDILSDEYRVEDKLHPNEQAWDIMLPAIIDKLNSLE